jgi:NADPH-dependent curcumin reductase CurA
MPISKQVHLVARPQGAPQQSDFAVVEVVEPEPGPGQVLIRNEWLSVDPYMRPRMDDVRSYAAPFQLNHVMNGGAVGTVVASNDPTVPVGTHLLHQAGWREYATLEASTARVLDTGIAPAPAYLGDLGMTGFTAYIGLKRIAPVHDGDVVFISGAAGAVGLVAGVIARKLGAEMVVGSAGGPEKSRRLVEDFGYDAALDYHRGELGAQLRAAAPNGIDVYFDNVGEEHLQAALDALRLNGRVALCGAIARYNTGGRSPGVSNLVLAIGKRLTLRGFLVGDHYDLYPEYLELATEWLREGTLRCEQTVVTGIEHAVDAFQGLLQGTNTGKMLIRLSAQE